MMLYYRKASHPTLKASMGALMAGEKNPVRTLVIGPFAITWARHSETDTETYTRVIKALTVAEYDLNKVRAKAWHEGYGHGREDQAEETRTGQMHVTLNPHELPKEPGA